MARNKSIPETATYNNNSDFEGKAWRRQPLAEDWGERDVVADLRSSRGACGYRQQLSVGGVAGNLIARYFGVFKARIVARQ